MRCAHKDPRRHRNDRVMGTGCVAAHESPDALLESGSYLVPFDDTWGTDYIRPKTFSTNPVRSFVPLLFGSH
jgi:hypothetical protein